jgi:hypothetical protein
VRQLLSSDSMCAADRESHRDKPGFPQAVPKL